MAQLTITITDSVRLFGGAPSDKWNGANWNAFKWGEGTNLALTNFLSWLTENQSITDAIGANNNSIISDSLSFTDAVSSETLRDSAGYKYVFIDNTTDAANRSFASWTAANAQSTSWASTVISSTNWS